MPVEEMAVNLVKTSSHVVNRKWVSDPCQYNHHGKCDREEAQWPADIKHWYNICTMLDQTRRRWADVLQMLYKCFAFAGLVTSRYVWGVVDPNTIAMLRTQTKLNFGGSAKSEDRTGPSSGRRQRMVGAL